MTDYRGALSTAFPFGALPRDVLLICLSNIVGAFGEGLYFWVFPIYVRSLQASYLQLGIVLSALMGFAALVPIAGGYLADRYDRKKIMILAWTPWVFAPLIYSFAGNWLQLIPGTFCWGVSMIGLPAVTAYIITSVDDKSKLTSILSLVWSTYSFSYIFAPAVGSFLATTIGIRWVLRITTAFAAASTCIFFLLHSQHPRREETPDTQMPKPQEKELLRKIMIWTLLFATASFFISIGRPFVQTFLSENLRMNEIQIGVFGSIYFAGITFLGIAMGHVGDKWKKPGAITVCLLLYIISLVPILFVNATTILMVLAFSLGGSAILGQIVYSYVGTMAPKAKTGLWVSIPQTCTAVAAFTAPYLGGYLYTFSPSYAFLISVSAVPFLAIFALFRLKD